MSTVDINPDTSTVSARMTLRKSGSSLVVSIPQELVQALDWEQGSKIDLVADWDAGEMRLEDV